MRLIPQALGYTEAVGHRSTCKDWSVISARFVKRQFCLTKLEMKRYPNILSTKTAATEQLCTTALDLVGKVVELLQHFLKQEREWKHVKLRTLQRIGKRPDRQGNGLPVHNSWLLLVVLFTFMWSVHPCWADVLFDKKVTSYLINATSVFAQWCFRPRRTNWGHVLLDRTNAAKPNRRNECEWISSGSTAGWHSAIAVLHLFCLGNLAFRCIVALCALEIFQWPCIVNFHCFQNTEAYSSETAHRQIWRHKSKLVFQQVVQQGICAKIKGKHLGLQASIWTITRIQPNQDMDLLDLGLFPIRGFSLNLKKNKWQSLVRQNPLVIVLGLETKRDIEVGVDLYHSL